jgi:shikimate dehydrogenase
VSQYAVVGNPVKHSKSPQIHRLFARQTEQDLQYTAVEIQEEDFECFVRDFFSEGGAGLNVTVPYKEKAYELAEHCSERAGLAKAVNTLFLDDEGHLCGENTDGLGLVRDITKNHKVDIAGKRILILGAGGAVRGVLATLVFELPASITLMNRTMSRAEQLQEDFKKHLDLQLQTFDQPETESFDLIINGTSASLAGELPPLDANLIAEGTCCYDLMYGEQDTPFLTWSHQCGARLALDGMGMLVEQAAESFAIWRGVRPETSSVISLLKK